MNQLPYPIQPNWPNYAPAIQQIGMLTQDTRPLRVRLEDKRRSLSESITKQQELLAKINNAIAIIDGSPDVAVVLDAAKEAGIQ